MAADRGEQVRVDSLLFAHGAMLRAIVTVLLEKGALSRDDLAEVFERAKSDVADVAEEEEKEEAGENALLLLEIVAAHMLQQTS